MKVRMKKTVPGSVDGYTLKDFVEGTEHDLTHTPGSRDLAQVFIREGWAEEVGAPPPELPKRRYPLLEEYVARGYKAEIYDQFIAEAKTQAGREGWVVDVRPLSPEELEAEANERRRIEEEEARAKPEDLPAEAPPEPPTDAPPAPAPTPPAAESPASEAKPKRKPR